MVNKPPSQKLWTWQEQSQARSCAPELRTVTALWDYVLGWHLAHTGQWWQLPRLVSILVLVLSILHPGLQRLKWGVPLTTGFSWRRQTLLLTLQRVQSLGKGETHWGDTKGITPRSLVVSPILEHWPLEFGLPHFLSAICSNKCIEILQIDICWFGFGFGLFPTSSPLTLWQ